MVCLVGGHVLDLLFRPTSSQPFLDKHITKIQFFFFLSCRTIQLSSSIESFKVHLLQMDTSLQQILDSIISKLWNKIHMKSVGDHNSDYGNHHATMNFSKCTTTQQSKRKGSQLLECYGQGMQGLSDGEVLLKNGSMTFGIVKDKSNWNEDPMEIGKGVNEEMLKILEQIRKYLIQNKRECNVTNTNCMRVNIIKGAQTIGHLDDFRCSMLRNYFIFFPPYKEGALVDPDFNFCLTIRQWPNFKVSFVLFENEIMIPFNYRESNGEQFEYTKSKKTGGMLQMIRFKNGRAKWIIMPPENLNKLLPYKLFPKNIAVTGIANGRLRIISNKYKVYRSHSELGTISIQDLICLSTVNDKLPYRLYRHISRPCVLHSFYGWRNIHYVHPTCLGNDKSVAAIRMHIFFKNVRPVNTASQARFPNDCDASANTIDVVYPI